jgi:hypothetical protein
MRLRGAAWPDLNCKATRQIGSQAREQLGGELGDVICFAGMGSLGHRRRSGVGSSWLWWSGGLVRVGLVATRAGLSDWCRRFLIWVVVCDLE